MTHRIPTSIGFASGISLLLCLMLAFMIPSMSAQILGIGAYFGIASVTNVWLSVYRDECQDWMQGGRGALYSAVLLVSLVGELSRIQGINSVSIPGFHGGFSVRVPSALTMELAAAFLIVIDPLLVRPILQWVKEGVERGESEPSLR